MVTESEFNRSNKDCAKGLHVTLLVNEAEFEGYGDRILFVRIPIQWKDEKSNVEKPNAIATQGSPYYLDPASWKIRTMCLEVLSYADWDDICDTFASK